MDSTIIASIIGAAGTVLVTLITIRSSKLNAEIKVKDNSNFLYGEWNCEWWSEGEKSAPDDMPTVHFNEIVGNKISCRGRDKNGEFKMAGTISKNTLTLQGSRTDQSGGEIILTLDKDKAKMKGIWNWKDKPHGRPYGGDTIWSKAN